MVASFFEFCSVHPNFKCILVVLSNFPCKIDRSGSIESITFEDEVHRKDREYYYFCCSSEFSFYFQYTINSEFKNDIKIHFPFSKQTKFLSDFNHLSHWNYLGEEMPTEDTIQSLQQYLKLTETGEIDEAICEFMQTRWEQKIITWT